jgi:kynurenine formamidase
MPIYDLSVPIEDTPSEPLALSVTHQTHAESAPAMAAMLGASVDDLPDRQGWANDFVTMSSHNGTHVDAPFHYFPTCGGAPARTIDQMPLDWFYGDGVVLDCSALPSGAEIGVADLEAALARIGYTLKPRDIVLIRTDADLLWGRAEYFDAGAGMSAAATRWLIGQGIRVMGIDAWGWDRPFWATREEFARTGDAQRLWEAHRVGMDLEYCHIEKLANLRTLPAPTGFTVACFPVKVTGGSAGWSRVVAIFS